MTLYKTNVSNKCVNFVNEHSEIIGVLLVFIRDLANEQATPITEIQIRPEWATYSNEEAIIIDVTIKGTSQARFELLERACEVVWAYEESLSEEQQRLIRDRIYLQFDYVKE